ncbi:MAG: hypothetical protein EHM66_00445 [Deltaproteobacteria bacterium]|nr:MAG: hypothetical protein EHM66_00445 [Deltaproteobacteria bacterium]
MKTVALAIDHYHIPIPQFIRAIKTARENPEKLFKRSIKCWWERTGAQIIQEYREIIDENINRRAGLTIREEKDYTTLRNLQNMLSHRVIIRENNIPKRYRKHLQHRIEKE